MILRQSCFAVLQPTPLAFGWARFFLDILIPLFHSQSHPNFFSEYRKIQDIYCTPFSPSVSFFWDPYTCFSSLVYLHPCSTLSNRTLMTSFSFSPLLLVFSRSLPPSTLHKFTDESMTSWM